MKKVIIAGLILIGGYFFTQAIADAMEANYQQQYVNVSK